MSVDLNVHILPGNSRQKYNPAAKQWSDNTLGARWRFNYTIKDGRDLFSGGSSEKYVLTGRLFARHVAMTSADTGSDQVLMQPVDLIRKLLTKNSNTTV